MGPQMAKDTIRVHEFIGELIDRCGKTQLQIAREIGYERPNIIAMFRMGRTKVPIPKVPLLARSIHADPQYLMRLALEEYMPDAWAAICETFVIPTDEEAEIIQFLRAVAGEPIPRMSTPEQKRKLREFGLSLREPMIKG